MDNSKGQTIFLSVIGIATLLVAIIGATFAWFSVNVTGNTQASSIVVTTAILGSIIFEDGSAIDLSNIRPEASPFAEKVFYVKNTTSNLTRNIEYYVSINVTANTLSPAVNQSAGATGVTGDYFVHSITPNTTDPRHTPHAGDTVITTGELPVPVASENDQKIGTTNGVITGIAEHAYTYKIQFKESGEDQNAGQGTAFHARLQVHTTDTGVSTVAP